MLVQTMLFIAGILLQTRVATQEVDLESLVPLLVGSIKEQHRNRSPESRDAKFEAADEEISFLAFSQDVSYC
ncbi:hypothetical protein ACFSJU_14530 [Paradesertivirga mongoliensis]|uniref:Uncharacterized protein n=1 Tax=Paradesertivirga mongoliensis TaxID=2100740 RepID=A0ABW4ZNN8_9SPHI|nr:hypothetical protein [Pedobacter mongoliensis]